VLRRPVVLLAALAALLVLVVPAGGATAPAFPVIIHAANGDVQISARPTRIVSLSPTHTETLFAIGAGPQVIAVDDQSNYPARAPRTSLSGYRPNVEAIVSYRPDLVVLSDDGGLVAALRRVGITVLLEPAADNLAQAYEEMRQLGAATGHAAQARAVVRSMQVTMTKLIRSVPKGSRHLKVFHELGPDLFSATSKTFIGQVYKIFGFRNIADAADKTGNGYPQLSNEYVLAANPDLVVLSDTKCCAQSAKTVAARPGWSNVAAVRRHAVIGVSDDIASRWGPRIVDFVRIVAAAARRSES
jgi:iron complex transport system substrate-binding protein